MVETKIKVIMYGQRYGYAVITEAEYQKMLNRRVEAMDEDENAFSEWLEDEFSAYEVWCKSATEIKELFHKANVEYVKEELANDWEEIEKEVRVVLPKALVLNAVKNSN
jgi:hypothetical protein